ncbi:MAG: WD40 repeat domain-containing protein [Verrucomicrobiota bacterium]
MKLPVAAAFLIIAATLPAKEPTDDPLPPGAVERYGSLRLNLGPHYDFGLALAPDASWVAAKSDYSRIFVWDVKSGREIARIGEVNDRSNGNLHATPDGRWLIELGGEEGEHGLVHFYETNTWKRKRTLRLGKTGRNQRSGLVWSAAISQDGKSLAILFGRWKAALGIWDIETGKRLQLLEGFDTGGDIGRIAFVDGDRKIAYVEGEYTYGGAQPKWMELDLTSIEVKPYMDFPYLPQHPREISFGAKHSAWIEGNALVRLPDGTEEIFRKDHKFESYLEAVSISWDGKYLATIVKGKIQVWDRENETEISPAHPQPLDFWRLNRDPSPKPLELSGFRFVMERDDVEFQKPTEHQLPIHQFKARQPDGSWKTFSFGKKQIESRAPNWLFASPNQQLLAGAGQDQALIWNRRTGKPVHEFAGSGSWVSEGRFSPSGRLFAVGAKEPDIDFQKANGSWRVDLYDTKTWDLIQSFRRTEEFETGSGFAPGLVAFDEKETHLLIAYEDRTSLIWKIEANLR